MPVRNAAGVKGGGASWAGVGAGEVFGHGHLVAADPAQHGGLVEPVRRPDARRVVGNRNMALMARVEATAAGEADRDDVEGRAVVRAAGLGIDADTVDPHSVNDADGYLSLASCWATTFGQASPWRSRSSSLGKPS